MKSTRSLNQEGFTLIELMIAMSIGLVIIGGVLGVLISTLNTIRVNDAISRNQENMRSVFEMMGADLREVAQAFCVNDLQTAQPALWANNGYSVLRGYDNAFPAASNRFPVANSVNGLPADALVLYTSYNKFVYTPGYNVLSAACDLSASGGAQGAVNPVLTTEYPVGWYIGCRTGVNPCNNAVDRALFFTYVDVNGIQTVPVAFNILAMRLRFLQDGQNQFIDINDPALVWGDVVSIEIQLTFDESLYRPVNRPVSQVVTLRRREGLL